MAMWIAVEALSPVAHTGIIKLGVGVGAGGLKESSQGHHGKGGVGDWKVE